MIVDKVDGQPIEEDVFIFPASFAQQRLWFIEQLLPGETLYLIPLIFRLSGSLQKPDLERSLQAIGQRHEILRTRFQLVDGQLMQVVAPTGALALPLTDLRQLPTQNREAAALQQIEQEIRHPFQLDADPLVRGHLWQLQDREHWLLLTIHHIIFDEWSSGVLIRELGEQYAALVEGRPAALPDLPIQYADFAYWQRQWLQGEVLNTQLNYWKQQLQGVPVLTLPGLVSRPRQPAAGQGGASQLLELPQPLLERLEALSQQAGVTLFMTLLAAFQTLLYRYTGQTDIPIGSPIANRHRSELEGLIGFLVNSLVLRTDLTGDPSFRELLERVRQVTLAAYAHQDLPFEKLVEELQPLRNLGQNPLFQVVFALQNTPMEQLVLPGLVLSPVELETKTARFDLELYLWQASDNFRNLWGRGWQQADGLRGVMVYNTELFDAATIASLLHHFRVLLESIVEQPASPLSALPLLTVAEQQTRLQHWQNHPARDPDPICLHRLFEAQVRQRPQAIALRFNQQTFTYQQLNQGSNQLARYLQRLGIQPEMPVGLCVESGVEAIAAMLAILKAGGAYLPLDPAYPAERLHLILKDAGVALVLTQEKFAPALETAAVRVICLDQEWDAIAREAEDNLPPSETAEQPAYIIYTSGSTGTPKGVVVPHRAVNRLVCHPDYVQIEPGDRVAQAATLVFDAATFEIWGALVNGAELVGIPREILLSPREFVTELQRQQIGILFLTTALFNQTVSQIPNAFQSLKYLLFGGEMARVEPVRAVLQQGKPDHLIHVYGPTENTTFSTWYEVQSLSEHATTLPIGQAIAHTQVYVLDAHRHPVPVNGVGEIYLGGAGLALGYWQRPELTAERFIPLPLGRLTQDGQPVTERLYKTGDRAVYRPDGNLEFLGRTDQQIKLRGFRVELREIEVAIVQHPAVQSGVVVVRQPEADTPEQLVAYVVPEVAAALTERQLRSFLKAKLPAYMVPAVFVLLPRLPLTANGKVDRSALPPPLTAVPRSTMAPATSLEVALVELWRQLLGRSAIGIDDNFFELGGHSLLATQLVSRIRDRFQVDLPLRRVFETPTIADLARAITSLQGEQANSVLSPNQLPEPRPWEEFDL